MTVFFTVLHVMVCTILIVVVLLQRGKGAEIGAVFGGGASSTVFGSRGAGNFLSRLTTGAAVMFMVTSLILAYYARERAGSTVFGEEVVSESVEESLAPDAGSEETGGGFQEVGEPVQPEAGSAEPPPDAPGGP
ncbi:MAG: preprotein translocase subunit SecG [Myxococcota bacterium]